ncbi:hypothetical protein SmJEL517_g01130 [Synchytrium microbalum]|uniref:Zinc finger PHD-type domain-containing protein n=1 Tax=Synchytrium microbalum TaxID=1806994 RepID=A0A507CGI6_9FUNG|nr:uncharacterized protein SmJEL517_g01130 [Synchytrium microbalum]TPX36623.1 hypothetical protein SmJEL517_g01130 [Synchytrium microbalum]
MTSTRPSKQQLQQYAQHQQNQNDDEEPDVEQDEEGTQYIITQTTHGLPPQSQIVDEDEGEIRCICGYSDDDGYTIQCDRCFVWQHMACVGITASTVPETYLCEQCYPRRLDVDRAVQYQTRRLQVEAIPKPVVSNPTSGRNDSRRKKEVKESPRKKMVVPPPPLPSSTSSSNRKGVEKSRKRTTTGPSNPAMSLVSPPRRGKIKDTSMMPPSSIGRNQRDKSDDIQDSDMSSSVPVNSVMNSNEMDVMESRMPSDVSPTNEGFWVPESRRPSPSLQSRAPSPQTSQQPQQQYEKSSVMNPVLSRRTPPSTPRPQPLLPNQQQQNGSKLSTEQQSPEVPPEKPFSMRPTRKRMLHPEVREVLKPRDEWERDYLNRATSYIPSDLNRYGSNAAKRYVEQVCSVWSARTSLNTQHDADAVPGDSSAVDAREEPHALEPMVEGKLEAYKYFPDGADPIFMERRVFEDKVPVAIVDNITQDDCISRYGIYVTTDIQTGDFIMSIKGVLGFTTDFSLKTRWASRTPDLKPPFVFAHPCKELGQPLLVNARDFGFSDGRFVRFSCGAHPSHRSICNAELRTIYLTETNSDSILPALPSNDRVVLGIFASRDIVASEEAIIAMDPMSTVDGDVPQVDTLVLQYPCICEDTTSCYLFPAITGQKVERESTIQPQPEGQVPNNDTMSEDVSDTSSMRHRVRTVSDNSVNDNVGDMEMDNMFANENTDNGNNGDTQMETVVTADGGSASKRPGDNSSPEPFKRPRTESPIKVVTEEIKHHNVAKLVPPIVVTTPSPLSPPKLVGKKAWARQTISVPSSPAVSPVKESKPPEKESSSANHPPAPSRKVSLRDFKARRAVSTTQLQTSESTMDIDSVKTPHSVVEPQQQQDSISDLATSRAAETIKPDDGVSESQPLLLKLPVNTALQSNIISGQIVNSPIGENPPQPPAPNVTTSRWSRPVAQTSSEIAQITTSTTTTTTTTATKTTASNLFFPTSSSVEDLFSSAKPFITASPTLTKPSTFFPLQTQDPFALFDNRGSGPRTPPAVNKALPLSSSHISHNPLASVLGGSSSGNQSAVTGLGIPNILNNLSSALSAINAMTAATDVSGRNVSSGAAVDGGSERRRVDSSSRLFAPVSPLAQTSTQDYNPSDPDEIAFERERTRSLSPPSAARSRSQTPPDAVLPANFASVIKQEAREEKSVFGPTSPVPISIPRLDRPEFAAIEEHIPALNMSRPSRSRPITPAEAEFPNRPIPVVASMNTGWDRERRAPSPPPFNNNSSNVGPPPPRRAIYRGYDQYVGAAGQEAAMNRGVWSGGRGRYSGSPLIMPPAGRGYRGAPSAWDTRRAGGDGQSPRGEPMMMMPRDRDNVMSPRDTIGSLQDDRGSRPRSPLLSARPDLGHDWERGRRRTSDDEPPYSARDASRSLSNERGSPPLYRRGSGSPRPRSSSPTSDISKRESRSLSPPRRDSDASPSHRGAGPSGYNDSRAFHYGWGPPSSSSPAPGSSPYRNGPPPPPRPRSPGPPDEYGSSVYNRGRGGPPPPLSGGPPRGRARWRGGPPTERWRQPPPPSRRDRPSPRRERSTSRERERERDRERDRYGSGSSSNNLNVSNSGSGGGRSLQSGRSSPVSHFPGPGHAARRGVAAIKRNVEPREERDRSSSDGPWERDIPIAPPRAVAKPVAEIAREKSVELEDVLRPGKFKAAAFVEVEGDNQDDG